MIHTGDCLTVMRTMPDASVSAVVTDPPYDLLSTSRNGSRRINNPDTPAGRTARGFMGKAWDGTGIAFRPETWAECYRLLRPGGHLLAFGGTRTYHRLAVAIEDAGFEIRDTLVWAYASGFPKSLDVSKAMDRLAGVERAVIGRRHVTNAAQGRGLGHGSLVSGRVVAGEIDVTAPATEDAQRWQGWGTALKPAWEPIIMARKPLVGSVARNVREHGTGALNIDSARIGLPDGHGGGAKASGGFVDGYEGGDGFAESTKGRWPANVVLTDPIFDGDTPGVVGGGEQSGGGNPRWRSAEALDGSYNGNFAGGDTGLAPATAGTYSRFFLIAKADRADREPVVKGATWTEGTADGDAAQSAGGSSRHSADVASMIATANATCKNCGRAKFDGRRPNPCCDQPDYEYGRVRTGRSNSHPTVKPTDLMRHLVRLVTPSGGTVLDPFLGSGTTAIACELEGFPWVGIEREAEYVAIAEARLNGTQRGMGLDTALVQPRRASGARSGASGPDVARTSPPAGQMRMDDWDEERESA